MHKFLLPVCWLVLLCAGCSRSDGTASVGQAGAAVPGAAVAVAVAPAATLVAPAAPPVVAVPPEDRLEPVSIENARLPNGSSLSVEPPADADKKKSRP